MSYKEFQTHLLNSNGIDYANLIKNEFNELLDTLSTSCGIDTHSRECAIMKTKLEEACFYAKKAMATNPLNQE